MHLQPAQGICGNVRADLKFRRPVIRKFRINHRKPGSDDHLKGVGKIRIIPILNQGIIGVFFIKKHQPVPVKIEDIIPKFTGSWIIKIRMHHAHEFVIRIGIIEVVFIHPTVFHDFYERIPGEGSGDIRPLIAFNTGKPAAQMIFFATGKIFESQSVLNGNDDPPAGSQMLLQHVQKILIGMVRPDIGLPIFKDPDEEDILVVSGKRRLDVPEISHVNRHIFTVFVSVSIDQTALFGQVYTVHLSGLGGQSAGDGAATAADF